MIHRPLAVLQKAQRCASLPFGASALIDVPEPVFDRSRSATVPLLAETRVDTWEVPIPGLTTAPVPGGGVGFGVTGARGGTVPRPQRWESVALQSQICRTVPLTSTPPVTSRHMPEFGLTSEESGPFCQRCAGESLQV